MELSGSNPEDPIAERLKKAAADLADESAASTGERLLKADFGARARQEAAGEFEKIKRLLRERGAAINKQRPPQVPELRFVEVNHRLDAGKFAVELQPIAGLQEYVVRILVRQKKSWVDSGSGNLPSE